MQTECNPNRFDFARVEARAVVASFAGGKITSAAGALLLGATEKALGLVKRLAACFRDSRDPVYTVHSVETLLMQRIFGIALGYEDLNDHDELRHDPMMALLAGKLEASHAGCAPVAGKSTLNRLERGRSKPTRYSRIAVTPIMVENLFLDAHDKPPSRIVLDLDATDDLLHGDQEGRFFHGYYDNDCYLPLHIFCGRHLLAAKLRTADRDGADGSRDELIRVVGRIRAR